MQQRLMALVFGVALVVSLGVALVGTPPRTSGEPRAAAHLQAAEAPGLAAEPMAAEGCGMAGCGQHGACGMASCPKQAPANAAAPQAAPQAAAPAAAGPRQISTLSFLGPPGSGRAGLFWCGAW